MDKPRPCKVKTGTKSEPVDGRSNEQTIRAEEPAIFHRFADRPQMHEGQMYALTVAIVEMNDGTVREVSPTDVRFTDRIS